MKITFRGQDLQHVVAEIGDFLNDLYAHAEVAQAAPTEPTSSPDGGQTEKPARLTRTRRKPPRTSSSSEKPARGRRQSAAPAAELALKPARGQGGEQTASAGSPSEKSKRGRGRKKADDITSADLSKAASALAEAANPQVVLDLLRDFGVKGTQDLEGDARREFLTSATEMLEDK